MRFNYDSDADALAIVFADGAAARTEQLDSGTLVDVDADGTLLAIEVLSPARVWPLEEIAATWAIEESDLRVLRAMFASAGRYAFTPTRDVASENRDVELVGA